MNHFFKTKNKYVYAYGYLRRIHKVVWRKDDFELDEQVTLVTRPFVDWHTFTAHDPESICMTTANNLVLTDTRVYTP